MRGLVLVAVTLALTIAAPTRGQDDKSTRYGVALDAKIYPQDTPRTAFASVLRAIDNKKFDYLAAQLADPTFVDDRVKRLYGGVFDEQVSDTRTQLGLIKVRLLRRFNKDGKWDIGKSTATVSLAEGKDAVKDKEVRFVLKGDRWYLQNELSGK